MGPEAFPKMSETGAIPSVFSDRLQIKPPKIATPLHL